MIFSPETPPTRAVVLGGGGAVGVSWQTGLLTGLRDAGVDLAKAEATVGTSAGALVGALLASGRDVHDALTSLALLAQSINPASLAEGDAAFLSAMSQASLIADAGEALRGIGRAANEANTPAEDTYLQLFATLESTAWPSGFRCTAIDTESGELVVWDENSGVGLAEAVASSCAIPMLFPSITIQGRRFMDGGILSHVNAAAAPATDILVVLSCHPLASKGAGGGGSLRASVAPETELAPLRAARRVVAIEPDFSDVRATAGMMDPTFAREALRVGNRQAHCVAAAIQNASHE